MKIYWSEDAKDYIFENCCSLGLMYFDMDCDYITWRYFKNNYPLELVAELD